MTVVNPLRGRSFFRDSAYIIDYISLITKKNIAGTWLLQYDNLDDKEIVLLLTGLPKTQELGIFLEVSEKLAGDAYVGYLLGDGDWARADKVLLSGYKPTERLRMIDAVFEKFKKTFGYYPRSVGAWYIDTLSSNYMVGKYKIQALMIVADQYQTDGYGIWGIPWGVPFFPSINNTLIPAQTVQNRLDVAVIQWAQRDAVLGYGDRVSDSTFSVQANDYKDHHQLDTNYFLQLAHNYLDASDKLNQLTIGLEVGQESVRFLGELERQIDSLQSLYGKSVQFVTMKDFANTMKNTYKDTSPTSFISGKKYTDDQIESYWYNSPFYRLRIDKQGNTLYLSDLREYRDTFTFADVGTSDKEHILKRIIPACIDKLIVKNEAVLIRDVKRLQFVRSAEGVIILATKKDQNESNIHLSTTEIQMDGNTIFSASQNPWYLRLISNLKRLFMRYLMNRNHSFTPSIRFTKLENVYYAGMMADPSHFWGFRTKNPFIGSFTFPFQVLTRFKTIPAFNLEGFASRYFSKMNDTCTIKLPL